MMGGEAAWNMVMIPSACTKASGLNNFKQYFQNKASVKNLSMAVKNLLTDKDMRNQQIQGFDEAIKYVINSSKDPSYLAAKAIMRKM